MKTELGRSPNDRRSPDPTDYVRAGQAAAARPAAKPYAPSTLFGELTPTQALSLRVASICDRSVFVSLLLLMILAVIPYGTSEPWWKA
ncbi:MAG TPA: hypothetical protein VFH31_17220, partial [Pyrinomonadaceae bacterium]|nr:hypothetical protein [Pyrinomonadaceae bacterium]